MDDAEASTATSRRLNGWKEIAAYFGKGTRTVQRWEREFGLPVRRIGNEVVYAFAADLEAWRRRAESANRTPAAPAQAADDANAPAGQLPSGAGTAARGALARWRVAALFSVVIAGLGFGFFALRSRGDPPAADWSVDLDTLVVMDVNGATKWKKQFRSPFMLTDSVAALKQKPERPVVIVDLDGDGQREVAVLARLSDPAASGLYLFDGTGRQIAHRAPSDKVRFGDHTFGELWLPHLLFAPTVQGRPSLWATWVERTGESPCLLERIEPSGRVVARYWSSGYIGLVDSAVVEGRPSILVGACDNDHDGASLAVFDLDAVAGTQPTETSDETCRDCPPGGPRTFMVFPKLGTMLDSGWFPQVSRIAAAADGGLRVWVEHGRSVPGESALSAATAVYDFDADLRPLRARLSPQFTALVNRLQNLRLLPRYPLSDDEQRLWPVRLFRAGREVQPLAPGLS